MSMFVDDAKVKQKVENEEDCEMIQRDLKRIWDWSKKWKLEFNTTNAVLWYLEQLERE